MGRVCGLTNRNFSPFFIYPTVKNGTISYNFYSNHVLSKALIKYIYRCSNIFLRNDYVSHINYLTMCTKKTEINSLPTILY